QQASESALPFAELLVNRLTDIADGLRRGDDAPALSSLGESTGDIESFLTYLSLVSEIVESEDSLSTKVVDYIGSIAKQVESLEEPLSNLDLVEVADTIELDIVRNLEEYADIHKVLCTHLAAAN
ncbi:MAG: hypothetical protein ACPHRO_11880, partial [Nannocystaceae bacterium]